MKWSWIWILCRWRSAGSWIIMLNRSCSCCRIRGKRYSEELEGVYGIKYIYKMGWKIYEMRFLILQNIIILNYLLFRRLRFRLRRRSLIISSKKSWRMRMI
jgi:hypothetical protein